MKGFTAIGRLGTPHGTNGQLKAYLDTEWENMEKGFVPFEAFFVQDDNGLPLPFFIENFELTSDGFMVKLEEVDAKEQAFGIAGKLLYLPETMVQEAPDETARYAHLIGYAMVDARQGHLGTIDDVFVLPMQEVARVIFKGKELLLPLNEELITGIDEAARIVNMDLPEGLTELEDHEH